MNSFHLILIFFFFFTEFLSFAHGCHDIEREALLKFKSSLVIYPPNLLSSWQETHIHRNCCNWHGVQCSHETLHVISINLRGKNRENYLNTEYDHSSASLRGKISPFLFNLTHLEYLDLSLNDFQGSHIPHEFNNLKKLTYLDISLSSFSGPITTQFQNLSSLSYLDLSCLSYEPYLEFRCLKAPSLNWVKGANNLKALYLMGVDLSEASSSKNNFVEIFSYNSKLRDLDLSSCNISTTIFPEFHNHSRLSSLIMNYNPNFQSTIPVQLANLTSLSKLHLKRCNLQGPIPYLPQLRELYAGDNSGLYPKLSRMFVKQWPKLQVLDISSTKVMGPIPSSISSNAPSLVGLIAPSCSIQGSIPSSICNISSLEALFLSSNNLTGTIPHCVTKLRNLMYFDVVNNSIGGNVSLISLINELNLHTLTLDPNKLTVVLDDGQHLSKFQLQKLSLKSCNLKGLIPTFICNLTLLESLDLSINSLTGAIPFCIFKMNNLIDLDLSQNNLQGTLPHILHLKFGKYTRLNLSHNNLHGALPLPPKDINTFDLSHNNFTGEISLEIGERLSSVSYISLSGNQLSGSIPFSICPTEPDFSLKTTNFIDLSNNKLSGVIPTSIGNCSNLKSLNLGSNNLTGSVPEELEAVPLRFLLLNDNKLEGTVLNSVSELQFLQVLNLANNNFEGSMPAAFGSLIPLRILSLRSNKFNGSIPEEIIHFSRLQILDLSRNYFSGKFPRKVGNLEMLTSRPSSTYSLEYSGDVQLQMVIKGIEIQLDKVYDYSSGIDLSCNILEGDIPEEIGLLKGLSMLNLSHNSLSGRIPRSVGSMKGLESLDLSFNKLVGQIPESLASMDSLGFLNLSYNNLSGRIPRGLHLDTLNGDGSAYVNNSFLCGFPTNNICEGVQSNNTTEEDYQDDAKEKLLLYAIVVVGFIVGFWGLFFVLLLKKEKWWFPYWKLVDIVAGRVARCLLGL